MDLSRILLSLALISPRAMAAQPLPTTGLPLPTTGPALEIGPALEAGPLREQQDNARLALEGPVRLAREPLGDALAKLQTRSGVRFSIDWKSLDAVGVGRETPAAVDWRDGEKVSAALGRTLLAAGEGKSPLAYTVGAEGGILITSERDVLRNHLVTRWYDLRDLLPNGPKEFTFSNRAAFLPPFRIAEGPPYLPHPLWNSLDAMGRAMDPAWQVASAWDLALAAPQRGVDGVVCLTATRLHHLRFSTLLAAHRAADRVNQPPPPQDVPPFGVQPRPPARDPRLDGWTVQAVERQLDRRIPELRFDALGLSDVLDFLGDVSGVPVEGDWTALEAAGLSKETPVSVRRNQTPFREAIQLALKAAQAQTKTKLHYWIDEDRRSIVLTTFDNYIGTNTVTRTYDVGVALSLARPPKNGADPVDALVALIRNSVAAGSWEGAGDKPGAVRRGPASELTITHLRQHHPEVEALIGRVIEQGFPP